MIHCLESLVSRLNALNSKATSDFLGALLLETTLSAKDLEPVLEFGEKNYRRHLMASSDWYDLWVICWRPGQGSPIHDHKDSSCAFRVVDGTATERVYQQTQAPGQVKLTGQLKHSSGTVVRAYKPDIHRVQNDAPDQNMVTLHIYSPPLQMTYYEEVP